MTAIRTLQRVEAEARPATTEERAALARFGGFGPVALSLFPNPATGRYKDESWAALGAELQTLLAPEEYASAKRTTFNAFYTSPTVITAMHAALTRLGVPDDALVLEPGCGTGNFLLPGKRYIGIEQDSISGRIARARHPDQDVRIENFADTTLPELDAVIGNVPFADVRLEYRGQKFALHDFFLAKSVDALAPGGVLALVTSHYTLDKQNGAIREYLADRADFLGAVRLPSDAFRREGTAVVTDIVFLRKRALEEPPGHVDPDWLKAAPTEIEGVTVPINNYFRNHPEQVLGTYTSRDSLYGAGYGVRSTGDLAHQLRDAVARLPELPARLPRPRPVTTAAFVPPPPERHIAEGSFFVHDQRVHQVVDGQPASVVYGGSELWAHGGLVGRRVAALIELRDLARHVLQSQNEGWSELNRANARRELNRAYDWFVSAFGPINKTTFSATADGSVTRRMPNLVKFREDPDAMLVMSLEEYDEVTGEAQKAPILLKDVVGRAAPVTAVSSAEDGLLVALDQTGTVDLPFIARLYGRSEDAVIAELGERIYRDPETRHWVPADEYLSGNVRAKLAAAERAGVTHNIEALRAVQPEDVLPGDIDANLGAPWIPSEDVQAFAAHLFQVPADAVTVAHLPKDAVWAVEGDYRAQRAVAVTADYGTERAGGLWLLELALNMKAPVIYDPDPTDPDKRVVNPEATLAAKEKQKLIRDQFRAWVFADPDRTERLVRLYNDAFNNVRPRQFDGSHLAFPGMSRAAPPLRPHQKDAVWRGMSGGNTLLAHVVGAGKTGCMVATAMKMKQAGLIRKPLVVVPNHLLEQFAREFQQWYPNARLLVAGRDDFTRERRKALTAKIATGDWDAVIVTHSGFERIGMSRDFQARFLREQIAEYDRLLTDRAADRDSRARRNILKSLEKQKAAREARLKNLLAADKKDDGLVFDELGVDHILIDEAHYFKNLETATKMDRVAGIQTGGSERAFDLFMKCRYLHERRPGHGVTFATGTPVSNTLVELYTLQRFLDPEGLTSRGLEHFDAWAATFGEVVEAMEISPDGKTLKPRSRFAKFVNLPELQQMFRQFADVRTAEMLNLPRPALEGGKPHVVACPMSTEQQALQQELVARYERVRSQKIDPREDNALAITTDGRKLALDARMLAATAPDFPGSKVNAMTEKAITVWERTAESRGTQLIFCDMGVHPTPWGYGAYDEIVAKLVQRGVPREQITVIGEADSDAKKQALFEKVRQGTVRVLMGSTAKMGTGTNVQTRLVAVHHLDAPWKPAEVEQRDGRILRQGNTNAEVAVYRYVTEGSFDAYMWQALETKAKFISQVMTGEAAARRAEDVGGQELSYAEVKAIASGNPAVLVLAGADAELQRLAVLRRNHADEQYLARRRLRELPDHIARLENRTAAVRADQATVAGGDAGGVTIGGTSVPVRDAHAALARALERVPGTADRRFALGRYRGLVFGIEHHGNRAEVYLTGRADLSVPLAPEARGARAVLNALNRVVDSYAERLGADTRELELARAQFRDYEARLGRPFAHAAYLDELTDVRDRLKAALSGAPTEGEPDAAELAERITALKAAHGAEAVSAPIRDRPVVAPSETRSAPAPIEDVPGPEVVPDVVPPVPDAPPPSDDEGAAAGLLRTRVKPTGTQPGLF
ncbi:dna methylase : Helicase, C-terminal OS=Blastopirellula marina DSM 3645 GN=DSM3645_28052 PE=4 SV=1: Methyltransf_26: SNF2_N [Gemmata massiliana]|uniref:Helicase C-terminal domain-containing protein n=1 Tax=Gemmata massiliana TaxID=1210884 RepID=A0A6P2DJU1_9BACT|nr:SNF2-related protein [Gemmata massiliana]VTS00593.1 dna methylase : Helicase, C-terminal OS=Blastopirellula marina DSM 3645 GN=DSM3645_28052 PE=4 SV=1: Methyltransf_26: SNF2_N [Gemmata massiliana]